MTFWNSEKLLFGGYAPAALKTAFLNPPVFDVTTKINLWILKCPLSSVQETSGKHIIRSSVKQNLFLSNVNLAVANKYCSYQLFYMLLEY